MPKEIVYSETRQYDLEIGWHRDGAGSVQVGIATGDGRTIADHLSETPASEDSYVLTDAQLDVFRAIASADKPEQTVVTPELAGAVIALAAATARVAAFQSLWASLDWAGCNRLIKVVRLARDYAFGKPE